MKSRKLLEEPTGRMVNNHGHWEYRYDDRALNPPLPQADDQPRRGLRAVLSAPAADPEALPAAPAARRGDAPDDAPDRELDAYVPAALAHRHDGWTAERQRTFLAALSETGSISIACAQAGVSSRSAYRLRAHPGGAGFAAAWDLALKLATARLTALAYERATRGTVRETWVDGELRTTTRAPLRLPAKAGAQDKLTSC